MNSENGKYYERETDLSMDEFPYAASFGGSRNRGADVQNVNLGSQLGGADDNIGQILSQFNIPDANRNQILGIPSFLQYPQDLGKNRRYHHFMCFNIYQGESDSTRVQNRIVNQSTSALAAKGEIAGGNGSRSSWEGDYPGYLTQAGFSQEQIDFVREQSEYGSESRSGVTANEQILQLEKSALGGLGNILSGTGGIASIAGELGLEVGETFLPVTDLINYAKSIGGDVLVDKSGELNKIDYERRGISGRKVNRPKWEQNILLANRRFGYANVKSKDTICLYMPLKITANDQLIYSDEDMGMMRSLISAVTLQRGGVSSVVEKAGTQAIANLINQATGMLGIEAANIQAARNASTRSVTNPRREMMFKDVGIRNHSFTFEFAPKNPREAQTVLDIIRMFRYHAYPALRGGGGHFFKFPAEFEATFFTITDAGAAVVNDHLPKLPRLALAGVNVDYSAAGDFKTFHDSKPAFITMTLEFQEMEQLNNEHIVHGY
jgi:hypothetical protein